MSNLIRKILWLISGLLPLKVIAEEGKPYLERYYVGTLFGTRCYLHRFVASDPDRGLHDHPWRWALSLVLAGWYMEETRIEHEMRFVRWINRIGPDTFHRVILPAGERDVWTLFFHRRGNVKRWGFLRPNRVCSPMFDTWSWLPYIYDDGGTESGPWWLHADKGAQHAERVPFEGLPERRT
jgi:hypothetical protein